MAKKKKQVAEVEKELSMSEIAQSLVIDPEVEALIERALDEPMAKEKDHSKHSKFDKFRGDK